MKTYEDVQNRLDRAKEYLQKARLFVDAAETLMHEKGHRVDDDNRVLRMRVLRGDVWNAVIAIDELIEELGK